VSENRQITLLVTVSLVIGLLGIAFIEPFNEQISLDSEVLVEDYNAVLYLNGTLIEEFTYRLNQGGYRFLYRNWEAPVSLQEHDSPFIQPVNIIGPSGTMCYIKDNAGEVTLFGESDYSIFNKVDIQTEAYDNEVGCFKPDYYNVGSYRVKFIYKLHPPIEYDEEYSHLNLKLASEHVPYSNVRITLEDAELIDTVYPHPNTLNLLDNGDQIIITGSSPKDQLLEIELILDKNVLDILQGFPAYTENVAKNV